MAETENKDPAPGNDAKADAKKSNAAAKPAPQGGAFGWIVLAVVLIGAGILVYAGGAYLSGQKVASGAKTTKSSGVPAIGGPFTLTDHNGNEVTERSFRGKYMLVFFGYTFCPDVCPTTLTDVSTALDILGFEGEKIVPVFISVDPARDTPEHLKEYATYFHPRLVALTGTPKQVAAAAKAYRVYYAKAKSEGSDPNDYLMDHSSVIYLMGPDGKFQQHFSHGTDGEAMVKRIRELLS